MKNCQTEKDRQIQYEICKKRGHVSEYVGGTEWNLCKNCGVEWRDVPSPTNEKYSVTEERNVPDISEN